MDNSVSLLGIQRKTKLLVVDDDSAVNETLSLIFQQCGYEVTRAHNGTEALQSLSLEPPDIVLLDVVLPDMSGIEIAIRIKRDHPSCRFLLLSGNRDASDALEIANANGHNFEVLAKPVPVEDLMDAVRALWR